MSSLQSRCLDSFPAWLRALPDDARALSVLLETEASDTLRRAAAVALTYLFKSLDLIPDGLEDLGYIDDAFVFRVVAATVPLDQRSADASGTLSRLAEDAALIEEFLGGEYGELQAYTALLDGVAARGRKASELVADGDLSSELAGEVRKWADAYVVPGFSRDEKNLVKLRSFLITKLRGA